MIAEDAVVNMDKNLDRIRAAGDIKRFFAKKRLGIYLTEEGAEVAREYVKLFEENFKKHLSPSEKTNPELLTV